MYRDPRGVEDAASRHVADARSGGDDETLSRALAIRGRARRALGQIEPAESDLREAVAAGEKAGDDDLVADALVGLAGVLSFAGRSTEAFQCLDAADRLGSGRIRGHVALQRGLIKQKIGHLREALTLYEAAVPTLRGHDARLDLALVLMNCGVIRTQLGDCDRAVDDLTESGALFSADGNTFGYAQTRHGLGWAYARSGELPVALQHLDDATERFHRLGHAALEVDVDRVEVLLSAGLFIASYELGLSTARQLAAAGNHSRAAEVWLLCARAALLDGDRAGAAAHAERARELYARQHSEGWELAARLEVLRVRFAGADIGAARAGSPASAGPCQNGAHGAHAGVLVAEAAVDEMCDLAAALDAAGNSRGAVTALALACLTAAESGAVARSDELSAECRRRASRLGVFEVRMLAAHAGAVAAMARADVRTAKRHIRAGLDDLAQHRASLAATDARAAVGEHAAGLASLAMRLAVRSGSAAEVLRWSERVRTGRAANVPARPPDDPAYAAHLVELRSVVNALRGPDPDRDDEPDLLRRQHDLERAIHRRSLRHSGATGDVRRATPTVSELRSALDGRTLVSLAGVDGRLVGVRVSEGTSASLEDAGSLSDMIAAGATILSLLRSLLAPSRAVNRADRIAMLRRALDLVDSGVRVVARGDGPVVLVVPPALHAVPWQLLPCFVARPVVVAPSATWWLAAQQLTAAAAPGTAGERVVVAAGPRLVQAECEATDIAACYPQATRLVGASATTTAVLRAMSTASIAHIACHGRIRPDNPLWSSLELADGPLCVYDLEQLDRTPPFVVLSGCETGVGVRAGDELLGLSSALLRHGTKRLVASVCVLPDSAATRETMTALHRAVASGVAPSTALAQLTAGFHPADVSDDCEATDNTSADRAMLAGCLAAYGTH